MSLSFSSFTWTRTSNTGKLMRVAQCKDSDKKPVGKFLGHFKAPRCSQSSASSYHPAAEMAEGNVCQRMPPSTALSHSAKSPLPGISVCQLQGLVAPRHRHVLPPAVAQQPWQRKTGMREQGQFLNQHSSLLLMWTSTYPLVHPGDRGSGWRNMNSAGGQVKVITF